jgi:hypothetical protein
MFPIARRGALLLLAALLAGCATRVPLDPQAAGTVRRLGVLPAALPEGPTSLLRHSPGQQFGLIGAIADEILRAERERGLRGALAGRGFDVGARWQAILADSLRGAGFVVVALPATRGGGRFLEAYPPAEVDAVLDVVITAYGYQAPHIVAPFHPHARVRTRLATPQGRPLMEETFEFGPEQMVDFGVLTFIASSPRNAFMHSGQVATDPDRIVAGLEEAMAAIAVRIAGTLQPARMAASAAAPSGRISAR